MLHSGNWGIVGCENNCLLGKLNGATINPKIASFQVFSGM